MSGPFATIEEALEDIRAGRMVVVCDAEDRENEGARVRSALSELGARGIQSLLLEGGPHLAGAFLDSGEIDEVRLFVAPMLVGGRHARAPLEGQGVEAIDAARRAISSEVERVHDDVLIRARMTEW